MTVWTYTWMVTTIHDSELAQEKFGDLAATGLYGLRDLGDPLPADAARELNPDEEDDDE